MRIVTRKEFDGLTASQRKTAFTLTLAAGNEDLIGTLFDKLLNTLSEPNEAKAFNAYWRAIRPDVKGRDILQSDLMPSFRYLRDKAYNLAIWQAAQERADTYALQYVTRDDSAVRWNHRAMNGVIQPVDSEFWRVWLPPNGFGCRCTMRIITQAQQLSNPGKYSVTDWNHNIEPDEGWA